MILSVLIKWVLMVSVTGGEEQKTGTCTRSISQCALGRLNIAIHAYCPPALPPCLPHAWYSFPNLSLCPTYVIILYSPFIYISSTFLLSFFLLHAFLHSPPFHLLSLFNLHVPIFCSLSLPPSNIHTVILNCAPILGL